MRKLTAVFGELTAVADRNIKEIYTKEIYTKERYRKEIIIKELS